MSSGPGGDGGPHVFVSDIDDPVLADDDRHHLERVLRLRPGDPFTVSDGVGRWQPCRLGDRPEPDGPVQSVDRPAPALTVGFAPVKAKRPELAVQKLTELGLDRIVLLIADHSVVRWDGDRWAHHHERLARVAREAAMQSRRCWLPEIVAPTPAATLAVEAHTALADPGGEPLAGSCTTVLVGPEGGWSTAEREVARQRVALADHVLRTETAAITAGAFLNALRAGRLAPTAHRG